MSNKFKATLLVVVLVVMGGSICSPSMPTARAQPNYTIKVAKTTEGDFTVTSGATYVWLVL